MFRFLLQQFLKPAGIRLDGVRPWGMKVRDERAFKEIIMRGSLGLGESYMHGWWDCGDLAGFFRRLLSARVDRIGNFTPAGIARSLRDRFGNAATRDRSFETGEVHYDLGNDFFRKMLDARMVYTCAYWRPGESDLFGAQEAKLDLVCRKIGLRTGQSVLDIGCGWGSFAKFAAERYGACVTGITISKEQAAFAHGLCNGLPVEIRVCDYRDFAVAGRFDHVVSLGMFEHVEYKNYGKYFACVERNLAPGGIFLLHTIGKEDDDIRSDAFVRKYVFPQGMVPGRRQLAKEVLGSFAVLDWHAFGSHHYTRTLRAWHENFSRAWPDLRAEYGGKLDGEFERMWRYYLLSCAGAFDAGRLNVWQIAMAKERVAGYCAVR